MSFNVFSICTKSRSFIKMISANITLPHYETWSVLGNDTCNLNHALSCFGKNEKFHLSYSINLAFHLNVKMKCSWQLTQRQKVKHLNFQSTGSSRENSNKSDANIDVPGQFSEQSTKHDNKTKTFARILRPSSFCMKGLFFAPHHWVLFASSQEPNFPQ